jgi:hypothetical protein
MSLIKANAVQIGQSPTATQNFTLAVPSSPDGTIKLARGNSGATTQDVMNVSNAGVVSFPQGLGNISNSTAIATGSTTARSLANRFADVVNVKDFGAVGNGVADDTAAIQAALNSGKALVFLPEGNYKVTASITIPENVTLEGTLQPMTTGALWDGATSTWRIPTNVSVIQVAFGSGSTSQSSSPIRLQRNSCVRGISFYYPSQSFSSPSLYPPTVSLKPIITGNPVTEKVYGPVIESCHFCNPWIAIEFTEKNGRCLIRNICGYAFKNFLFIDQGDEVNRVENIQLNLINTFYGDWPLNYILNWQFVDKTNAAVKIGSSDLLELKDVFCYGFWIGINIKQFSALRPNGIFISEGGFEGSARNAVIESDFRRIIFTKVQFGTASNLSDWNLNSANWPLCRSITVFADSLTSEPDEIRFLNCRVFRSLTEAFVAQNINDLSISNCDFYNSNTLNQLFATQVVKIINSKQIKIVSSNIEQGTNINGNYLNINSVNGFVVEGNTFNGQTKVSSNIFIDTSTAGRLNNNIEFGTTGTGVGQLGSTNVVSTNYVQY